MWQLDDVEEKAIRPDDMVVGLISMNGNEAGRVVGWWIVGDYGAVDDTGHLLDQNGWPMACLAT